MQPAEGPDGDAANRAIGGIARPFQCQLVWLWNRSFRFLFVIDAVTLFVLMVAINAVRFGTQWPSCPRSHYLIGFGIASLIHLTVNYFAGLYEREPRIGYRSWLPRIATAMGNGIALDALVAVLAGRYLMPRLNLGICLATGIEALRLTRHLSRRFANLRRRLAQLVLIGKERDRRIARERIGQSEATVVVAEQMTSGICSDSLSYTLPAMCYRSNCRPSHKPSGTPHGSRQLRNGCSPTRQCCGVSPWCQCGQTSWGTTFIRLRTHALAQHQLRLKR